MKRITRQEVIDGVPKRWAHHYRHSTEPAKLEITRKLQALVPPLNAGEVDSIIGNKSWTGLFCDECAQQVDVVVLLSDSSDTDVPSVAVCKRCLAAANKLIKEKTNG